MTNKILLTFSLFFSVCVLNAQTVSFQFESGVSACSGEAGVGVNVLMTNDAPVQAFSVGIGFDPARIVLDSLTLAGTAAEGADYFEPVIKQDEGWSTVGVIIDTDDAGATTIPAGQDQPVVGYVLSTSCGGVSPVHLQFEDGHTVDTASLPVENKAVVNGLPVVPALQDGQITIEEATVENVEATLQEEQAEICWDVSGCLSFLDSIVINRDGAEIAQLSPGQSCYTDAIDIDAMCSGQPGTVELTYEVVVQDTCGNQDSGQATVTIQCPCSLNTSVSPSGSGIVTADPEGPYECEDVVELCAEANQGWKFSHWSEDATALETTGCVTVTSEGERNIAANFEQWVWFRRGDCNNDGTVDVADAIRAADILFVPGTTIPDCLLSCEVHGDGEIDIADPVYLLDHLFRSGPAPAAPFPDCGPVPEDPPYTCDSFSGCP